MGLFPIYLFQAVFCAGFEVGRDGYPELCKGFIIVTGKEVRTL